MRQTRRSFRNGTKLPSERIWTQSTRAACRCCNRARQDGELFSNSGNCGDCAESIMVSQMLGMQVTRHWTEDDQGKPVGIHERLVSDVR